MELLKKVKAQFITGDIGAYKTGANSIVHLPLHLVMPNPNQPRKIFDHDALKELSESIRQYGIIQPVTVRKMRDGTYELVAGERRLKAAGLAGLLKIPAMIIEMEDEDSAIVALVENIQRQNLSFMEEALAYRQLLDKCNLTQEELAKKVGKTQSAIANKIRLLRLPASVREIIKDNSLSERHARALLRLDTEEKQIYAARRIVDFHMNVKQSEELVDRVIKNGIEDTPKEKIRKSIGDVRVFFKTITKAVSLMNENGIEATAQKDETDSYYEYVIRIQKV
ncbi:MAG: ParB/RepB/Spo0J family partition protein [Clostridia bacterium]|nr:ParB/RepB/Spo0J family partition protein [Clostridia bacterium]